MPLWYSKQGIYRKFNQWFADHIALIVDFLEKEYISYADQAFLYILQVDDHPDLLETIKKSNPKLKEIAMSVAGRLKQEGIRIGEEKGIRTGEEKGIRIGAKKGKLEIAKSMLLRGYPLDDIVVLTRLSPSSLEDLM